MQAAPAEPGAPPAERDFDPLVISERLGAHAPKYDQVSVERAEERWAWLVEDDRYRGAFHRYMQRVLAAYLDAKGRSYDYDGSGLMGELAFAVLTRDVHGERCPELKARARAHAAGEVTWCAAPL
jgi:hypothetical protein